MNIDELNNRLDKELYTVYKTILINGEWGTGKTYLINDKYINNPNTYYKVIYASLFGINSISELNTYILEKINTFLGTINKGYSKLLGGRDVGLFGLTIPLPEFEANIRNSLSKKAQKEKILVIIDDIERKSKNIDINELMGLFESISKIKNLSLILISNINKMEKLDKNNFELFKEKIVEKTYNINKYSKTAEKNIINNKLSKNKELREKVSEKFNKFNIVNLRTLEKYLDFINQNINYINFNILSDSQIDDILDMEIAIIIEKISQDYLKEKISEYESYLEFDKFVVYVSKKYYSGTTIYNNMLKIDLISKIYDDIDIEKNSNKINNIYKKINNPEISDFEKIDLFYLSEDQLKDRIVNFNNKYMNQTSDDLDIISWFKSLNYLYNFANKIGLKDSFKDDDICNTIELYVQKIDTSKGIYSIIDDFWDSSFETEEMKKYLEIIKNKISEEYYSKLITEVKYETNNNKFDNEKIRLLIYGLNEELSPKLNKELKENEYFIPDLNYEISEESWRYTHSIWKYMISVKDKNGFIQIIKNRLDNSTTLGRYRIDSLNKQYNIEI